MISISDGTKEVFSGTPEECDEFSRLEESKSKLPKHGWVARFFHKLFGLKPYQSPEEVSLLTTRPKIKPGPQRIPNKVLRSAGSLGRNSKIEQIRKMHKRRKQNS